MRAQILFSILGVLIVLIGALISYLIKHEHRISRLESWIEFVGTTAKGSSKVLERPTHEERDGLLRRYRCEQGPQLTRDERFRLAEILEIIATQEVDEIGGPNNSTAGEKLIAAVNAATIRYEMKEAPKS